jgi:hypothetical protein
MKNYSHKYISEFYAELSLRRRLNNPAIDFSIHKSQLWYEIEVIYEGFFETTFYVDFDGVVLFYGFHFFSQDFIDLIKNGKAKQF